MSTQIEVEVEEHEDEQNDVEQPASQTSETSEQPASQTSETPSEQPAVTPDYASKVVKKLTKDERSMLLNKFEQGVEDQYFKVIKMSNGQIRITKRKNPLTNDVKQAVDDINERVVNKITKRASGTHLTNEQLLMEHIIDLETRFECMRLKHKKLKRRYNELENSIYEDIDDKPVETHVETPSEQPEQQPETQVEQQPRTTIYERPRKGKLSWRDAINYM